MLRRLVGYVVAWVVAGVAVVVGYTVLHPTFQFSGLGQALLCVVAWPWFLYQVGYVGPVPLTRY